MSGQINNLINSFLEDSKRTPSYNSNPPRSSVTTPNVGIRTISEPVRDSSKQSRPYVQEPNTSKPQKSNDWAKLSNPSFATVPSFDMDSNNRNTNNR